MCLFFVNALADIARQFFLTHCSPSMPLNQIVSQMRRHYNSDTRQLQLKSEIDSLSFPAFMRKQQLPDIWTELFRLVDHINVLAPQLPHGFGDDPHKARYLRRAVMGYTWARQPIYQLTASRHTFVQFMTALNESLQLQDEVSRAHALDIHNGQYMTDPRDVRKHHNQRDDLRGWEHSRNQSPFPNRRNSGPWSRRYNRQRSRSPAYKDGSRMNPRIRNKRVCWG